MNDALMASPPVAEPFDLLTCPLNQRVLIEASAGTGKTWTLSMLVMRLLLEAGLDIDQILIVTFTEAATAELRTRIRQRIREGLALLAGATAQPDQQILQELLTRAGAQAHPRLARALNRMDRARISTIHGFCQHVLTGWPLLCGTGFEPELLEDQSGLVSQLVDDFWRTHLYPASETRQRLLLQVQQLKPADLQQHLNGILGLPDQGFRLMPAPEPETSPEEIDALWPQLQELFDRLQALWRNEREGIAGLLQDAVAQGQLSGKVYQARWLPGILKAGESVFAAPYLALPLPEALRKLSAECLQSAANKGKSPPVHAFFDQMNPFWEKGLQLSKAGASAQLELTRELILSVRQQLQARKRASNLCAFDDLLLNVHSALNGVCGSELAATLRQAYPAALIDEFQDTDQVQSEIFARIYPTPAEAARQASPPTGSLASDHPDPATALFLIGDPKQSIYRFRGADIFAYLRMASSENPNLKRYSLNTNFRSLAGLVRACHVLFSPPGVFQANALSLPAIPYSPIMAQRGEGPDPAAMVLWQEPDQELSAGQAHQRVARAVASEILSLLDKGHGAQEMAVLTRTHRQSRLIAQILQECRIPCLVRASEPVFASLEAWELERLLDAILWPGDAPRLKRALSTYLLGLSALEIAQLSSDAKAWDERLEDFRAYHLLLRNKRFAQGLARLWLELEKQEGLTRRLAALPQGERRLANLRQLQQLLLEAAQQPGMTGSGLLNWLRQQRMQPQSSDRYEQQLESEQPAVRIMTIHGSKGLEFPIVFCPWLWDDGGDRGPLSCYDPETQTKEIWIGDFAEGERREHPFFQRQQIELRAESIRLAYVALTRARDTCYLAWIWQKTSAKAKENRCAWSALGFLLGLAEQALDPAGVDNQLRESLGLAVQIRPLPTLSRARRSRGILLTAPPVAVKTASPPCSIKYRHAWFLSSFSNLKSRLPDWPPEGEEASAELQLSREWLEQAEPQTEDLLDAAEENSEPGGPGEADLLPALPGGSRIGSFLHKVLELVPFDTDLPGLNTVITRLLPGCPALRGFEATLQDLLWTTLQMPLDPERPGLKLAALAEMQRESAFYFPIQAQSGMAGKALGRLLTEHGYLPAEADLSLWPGLMTGRFDLVFGWQGRYGVLDYKSTYLGPKAQDYGQAQLETALQTSGQLIQGLLYSVALHRSLRLRLPGYDPEKHLDGVYFVFLRGLNLTTGPTQGIWKLNPPAGLIQALSELLGGVQA